MKATQPHRKPNAGRRAAAGGARAGQGRQLRIIGGRWRGTRLQFPAVAAIRPTPDRVRETLFNWLAPVLGDARCLDLFAGSGALGLEALSRGARSVVFVDQDRRVADYLRGTLDRLGATGGEVVTADAGQVLESLRGPFDIAFLDPPFAAGLVPALCERLAASTLMSPGAFVYVEAAADSGPPPVPGGWQLHRTGKAGQVGYHLLRAAVPDMPQRDRSDP